MKTWRLIVPTIVLLLSMVLPAASARAQTPPPPAPGAPESVAVTPANHAVTVSWQGPIIIQTYRVSGYQINVYSNGVLAYPWHVVVPGTVNTWSVGGLTNNLAYTFTVQAKLSTLIPPVAESLWGAASQQSAAAVPGITPSVPTKVDAHGTWRDAVITWAAPTNPGTSAVTGYGINVYRQDASGVYQSVVNPQITYAMGPTGMIGEVSQLDGTAMYRFTVQARNLTGWSAESTSTVSVLPNGYGPASPTIDAVTPGDGTLTVHWVAPSVMGLDHYLVLLYKEGDGIVGFRDAVTTPTVTFTGLDNGVAYIAKVRAIDVGHNMSVPASARGVPSLAQQPPAPLNLRVGLNDRAAAVYWDAPPPVLAAPIDHYAVHLLLDGSVLWTNESVHDTSVSLSPLVPGYTYTVEVRSVSIAGAKSNPASLTFKAGALPSPPLNVVATVSNAQVLVSWMPSAYSGGVPITGYIVTGSTGQPKESMQVMTGPGITNTLVSGLLLGRTYTFTVQATNAVGSSLPSAASNPITLATVPGMVRNLTVTDADQAATVKWDVPASDGYSPILSYQVTASDGVHAPVVATVTGTSVVLSQLTNGTLYTISVVAIDAVGRGQAATATVTPRNLPPVLTVPGAQTVQYSDALPLTVSALDRDTGDHVTLTASGLPDGLTFVDKGNGTGSVIGAVQAPAGTYTVTFSANDGHNAVVTGTTVITVTRETAVLTPAGTKGSLVVKTVQDRAKAVTVQLKVSEAADGSAGLLDRAAPVTVTLRPLGSGTVYTRTIASGVVSNGYLLVSTTFRNLPTGVYRVSFSVGGNYYSGDAYSAFTVYSPMLKSSLTAKGTVTSQTAPGTFSVSAKFLKTGKPSGTFVYSGQHPEGFFTLRGKVVGLVIRNHRAYLQGEGTMNGVSGFRFTVALRDNRHLGTAGQVSLWTLDPQYAVVGHCSFAISDVASGSVKVSMA